MNIAFRNELVRPDVKRYIEEFDLSEQFFSFVVYFPPCNWLLLSW